MIERIPNKGLALLLVSSLSAAGFAGYEIGREEPPTQSLARILGEHIVSNYVIPGEEVELLVEGWYGTPERILPFLTHFDINCTEPPFPDVHNPNPVVHSETVLGDQYSLENYVDNAPIDNGKLCESGTHLSADGVVTDTSEVLKEFDHNFLLPSNPGTYEGSAERIKLTKKTVDIFRKGIISNMKKGFGTFFLSKNQN